MQHALVYEIKLSYIFFYLALIYYGALVFGFGFVCFLKMQLASCDVRGFGFLLFGAWVCLVKGLGEVPSRTCTCPRS